MCLKSSAKLLLKLFLVTMYVVTNADTKLNRIIPASRGTGNVRDTGSLDHTIVVVTPRNANGICNKRRDRSNPTTEPIIIPTNILTPMSTSTEDMIEELGVPSALNIENCF